MTDKDYHCIVCNCGELGDAYLAQHAFAAIEMRRAEAAVLACRDAVASDDARRRYDKLHKRMVKLRRDWNRLEEVRETDDR